MNIGIVGSRRRNTQADFIRVGQALLNILEVEWVPDQVLFRLVSGGCKKGADSIADFLSEQFNLEQPIIHLPVLPDNYEELVGQQKKWAFAKAAYARNKLIARDSDILIAFVERNTLV